VVAALNSSNDPTNADIKIWNRSSNQNDPIIQLNKAGDPFPSIYEENGVAGHLEPLSLGGVAVWINEPIAASATTICFQNKNFKKAKWLPGNSSTWFSTTDNLAGTEERGYEGND